MPRGNYSIRNRFADDVDHVFGSHLVNLFINNIQKHGKKALARKIMYGVMEKLKEKMKKSPDEIIASAIAIVAPSVCVKSKRVGGSTYQVPVPVGEVQSIRIAIGWILSASRKRLKAKGAGRGGMQDALFNEIIDIFESRGGAFTMSKEASSVANANKVFAHFAAGSQSNQNQDGNS